MDTFGWVLTVGWGRIVGRGVGGSTEGALKEVKYLVLGIADPDNYWGVGFGGWGLGNILEEDRLCGGGD